MQIDGIITFKPTDTLSSAMAACELMLRKLGVVAGMYHLTPPFHSQVGKDAVITHFGYSDEIMRFYLDPAVLETNPAPDFVMRAGRTMSWRQTIMAQAGELNAKQLEFIETCRDLGFTNGLAIPLFGPHARNSYAAFLLPGTADDGVDPELAVTIVNLCQEAHRKICLLVERDHRRPVALSPREREVLYWMARAKSNTDIATILNISAATVDTFVRRLFTKLDVNDRISATIEGLSRSMVQF
jgi:DNA-binding CsgD family transcriptional regulator